MKMTRAEKSLNDDLRKLLKEKRKALGLSQQGVANAMNLLGKDMIEDHYAHAERGEIHFRGQDLLLYFHVLGISESDVKPIIQKYLDRYAV